MTMPSAGLGPAWILVGAYQDKKQVFGIALQQTVLFCVSADILHLVSISQQAFLPLP